MRLLLDTHMALAIVGRKFSELFPAIQQVLGEETTAGFVSVASLWEIAIKTRLGKLQPGIPLEAVPTYLEESGLTILPIDIGHVMTAADPEPQTRDPFDRLLLAQCQVKGLQLVTIDRMLVNHPLALKLRSS